MDGSMAMVGRRVGPAVILAAVVSMVLVVIGPAGRASSQTALPVVTASASDGLLTTVGNCSGSATTQLDPASVTVTRTGDTSTDLFVDLAWGGTIPSDYRPGEGLTIPAGSSSTTFEIDSGTATGTVTIEIGFASNPDAPYEIGSPSTATATVLAVITDPVCTSAAPTSTTLPAQPGPAPARPIPATADYTG